MSTSRTQTHTTSSSTAVIPVNPTDPADPDSLEEEDLEEDEVEVLRKAQEKVRQMKERKAAAAAAAKQKAEEEAREQAAAREERRRRMAAAATARNFGVPSEARCGDSEGEEQRKRKIQGPDGGDNDDKEDERTPCERCRNKKIPCQMQAGKRSSIICKPCHDAKVRCLYSNRPFTVKREGGSNPTGERLAVLESQVAQLLADNRQLRDGQVKANTYHRHFNRKLDWLITDAARRRRTPPELPEASLSGLSRKRRRVMDSDEEEEQEREMEMEEDGEGGEMEVEGEKDTAPTAAQSDKGKGRAEE
ncbi:MAG: hypothetical protein NXY57DRAFT_1033561 [Lentinula lateritia]|nr:MAG: hypothetical protein NXY57DRAFT_1033561 [Lentinula lateritia]